MQKLFHSIRKRMHFLPIIGKRSSSEPLDEVIEALRPHFDREWYVRQYPDCLETGLDPIEHYVVAGAERGHDPHPDFSTLSYLERNEDVRTSGVNPFYHWLTFGHAEGRDGFGSGDPPAGARVPDVARRNAMFSVFVCCTGRSTEEIDASLASLEQQAYRNFEVILLGCGDDRRAAAFLLSSRGLFCEIDGRPADAFREDGGVCWRGDYLMMLEAGDTLGNQALEAFALAAAQEDVGADLIVCDRHAGRDRSCRRVPGVDVDLLLHCDYLASGCAISRTAVRRVAAQARQDSLYDLVLAVAQSGASWKHVAEPLLHINAEPPTAEFALCGEDEARGLSIIIPNRDRPELLHACTRFLQQLRIPFELIIVDNGSRLPETEALYSRLRTEFGAVVLRIDHAFNYSRMVNAGVAAARHEFVLLLNNDILIGDPAVVTTAMEYAARPGVGVVGSVLHYPDGSVQHAGFVFWLAPDGRIASEHVLRHARASAEGTDNFWALSSPRGWQAVTGAFHLMRKTVYDAAGGYDESNFPIEYNDVDFCFRVRSMGMRVICLPLPGIIHDESSTRRNMETELVSRMRKVAKRVMKARWLPNFVHDPFFHPDMKRAMAVTMLADRQRPGSDRADLISGQAGVPSLHQKGTSPDAWGPRQLAPGLCILGYLNSEIGLGEAARNLGRACDATRLPISYVNRSLAERSNDPSIESFFQPRADRRATVRVEGLTLNGYNLKDEGLGRIQLLYVFWELPHIPEGARAMLDSYDEIWAASEFIATALRNAVRRPVRLIPQALDLPPAPAPQRPRANTFRFLTFFDFDSQLARKNPMAAIAAFRAAFPQRKDVELVVKARGLANDNARRMISDAIGGDRRIRLIDATLSRAEMNNTMREADAFVSLHRAEGFGFGAAEALAAGKAVIATNWSATSEFVTADTGFVVDYELRPVQASEYVYSEGQVWADPILESAVAQFRAVADNPEAAWAKARKGHELLLGRNSFTSVGARIASALTDLGAL